MKNIHNLLTDAFDAMGEDETQYVRTIVDDNITIKREGHPGTATIQLFYSRSGTFIDYTDANNLFRPELWNHFCLVFERQIPNLFHEMTNSLLQNMVLHDEEEADEAAAPTL